MRWLLIVIFVTLAGCETYPEPCNSDEAVREITRANERYLAAMRQNDQLKLQLRDARERTP